MPNTATISTLHHPDPATIARAAHEFAHSHYKRIDWTGAQVDFTEGAKWALAYVQKERAAIEEVLADLGIEPIADMRAASVRTIVEDRTA